MTPGGWDCEGIRNLGSQRREGDHSNQLPGVKKNSQKFKLSLILDLSPFIYSRLVIKMQGIA